MGNTILIILIATAAAFGAVYFYFNNTLPVKEVIQNTQVPKALANHTSPSEVDITKIGFIPAFIRIKKGAQLTWTNTESIHHQVVFDPNPTHTDNPGIDGLDLEPEESVTFIFERSGTFTYHDFINPTKYRGIVLVE